MSRRSGRAGLDGDVSEFRKCALDLKNKSKNRFQPPKRLITALPTQKHPACRFCCATLPSQDCSKERSHIHSSFASHMGQATSVM